MGVSIGDIPINPDPVFTFRPLTRDDLPLIFRWVQDPEISIWWGEPPVSQDEVDGKYIARIDGSENIACLIAELAGLPFAFIQWYRLADHPDHPGAPFTGLEYAGLDLFIGPSDGRSRGLGSRMIRQFLTDVLALDPDIAGFAIDPSVDNVRAIAAYRRAGFVDVGFGTDGETGKPCLVQAISRGALLGDGRSHPTADTADADKHQE